MDMACICCYLGVANMALSPEVDRKFDRAEFLEDGRRSKQVQALELERAFLELDEEDEETELVVLRENYSTLRQAFLEKEERIARLEAKHLNMPDR